MTLHDDAAYLALKTHDARFDGRFFVGVVSTGVYCRPVCRVRTPLRRNCRFYANAASAEQAGFRPCLRCRPELAPGLALVDSPDVLAQHAARLLDEAARAGTAAGLTAVAARLGVTDRHLRRIFMQSHGVSPLAYLTTQRLLLAKQLLTDTPLPVAEVALASGFGSVRRFNAAFAERYRLSPTSLRRHAGGADGALTLRLPWRPPYDVDAVCRFLARRAVAGVEAVDGQTLRRTLAVEQRGRVHAGGIEARFVPARCEVHVALSPGLAPAAGLVGRRVRQWLDLDADPALIEPTLEGLAGTAGTRVPGAIDGFEAAVRVVVGQQVTVAAARTLLQRLVDTFGAPLATPLAGLQRLFPLAATIAAAAPEDIGRLGIVRQRVGALQAVARAVQDGRLELHAGAPLASTLDTLRALPGIGEWSVQLIALRALAWPDAFPAADIGVLNALGTRDVAAATRRAEAWRPWRGYAVMRLWQTLETA